MPARITLGGAAPAYFPPLHQGVNAVRLQGHEAGPTDRFWVGLSTYVAGGAAELSPTAQETVYVVLSGELALTVPDQDIDQVLTAGDSVHLTKGTIRSVVNRGQAEARLLVIIATPQES